MAENFFGFSNSEFPGKLRALGRPAEDDFLADDVEEEYDALNDETFGAAANDDWEEAHEQLSSFVKSNRGIDIKKYFRDSLLENDDSQEQIVSKSLSQLGLEDDIDDPAIMTISRNCRSSSRLGSLFGPSPPPPAILETEICGSPKTHSIWSTTPKDSGVSFINSLTQSPNNLSHQDSRLQSSTDNVFISPQKAWRAEDLEKNLLSSQQENKSQNNQNRRREEVERQILLDQAAHYQNKVRSFGPVQLHHPNMPPLRTGNINIPMRSPDAVNLRLRGQLMGSPDRPYIPFPPNMRPMSMLPNQMLRPDFLLPNLPMPGVMNRYMGMPARPINHPLLLNYKQPFQMVDHHHDYKNDIQSEDEYAGLMSHKEKEWLIRVQMTLLKSDNPYAQDYYYTTMLARKCKQKYSETHRKGSGDAPELILPDAPRPEKAYVPTQFAGSLGKLQAVSVNFPRKVLDLKLTRTPEDEAAANQNLVKYRRLLIDIENLYSYFLEVEDEERRILAKPDTEEAPHRKNIETLMHKMFSGICFESSPEEHLQSIMTIRKGRNLFVRVLPLFSKDQQLQCLICLCSCLAVTLKKDQVDLILVKNFKIIKDLIFNLNLENLVTLGDALENGGLYESSRDKSNLVIALKNKFGSSLICTMVVRAESLYSRQDNFDNSIQSRWSRFMLLLIDILCNINIDALCPPLSPCTEFLTHIRRFSNNKAKFDFLKGKLQTASFNGGDNKNA